MIINYLKSIIENSNTPSEIIIVIAFSSLLIIVVAFIVYIITKTATSTYLSTRHSYLRRICDVEEKKEKERRNRSKTRSD